MSAFLLFIMFLVPYFNVGNLWGRHVLLAVQVFWRQNYYMFMSFLKKKGHKTLLLNKICTDLWWHRRLERLNPGRDRQSWKQVVTVPLPKARQRWGYTNSGTLDVNRWYTSVADIRSLTHWYSMQYVKDLMSANEAYHLFTRDSNQISIRQESDVR